MNNIPLLCMNELFLFGLNIVGCAVLCPIGAAAPHRIYIEDTERKFYKRKKDQRGGLCKLLVFLENQ